MGKWLARLAALGDDEKSLAPPSPSTDKTDRRGVLTVLAVEQRGGARDFSRGLLAANEGASRPYRLSSADADRCHWPPWTDAEIATFVARVALFLRRGMSATGADDLAERLVLRDREGDGRAAAAVQGGISVLSPARK